MLGCPLQTLFQTFPPVLLVTRVKAALLRGVRNSGGFVLEALQSHGAGFDDDIILRFVISIKRSQGEKPNSALWTSSDNTLYQSISAVQSKSQSSRERGDWKETYSIESLPQTWHCVVLFQSSFHLFLTATLRTQTSELQGKKIE